MKIYGDQQVQGIVNVSRRVVEGLKAQLVSGTYTLTARSEKFHRFTASAAATVKLPDATTLSSGYEFVFYTTSSNITLKDSANTALQLFEPGTMYYVYLMGNSTAAGEWVITKDTSYDISLGSADTPSAGIRAYFKTVSEYTGSLSN